MKQKPRLLPRRPVIVLFCPNLDGWHGDKEAKDYVPHISYIILPTDFKTKILDDPTWKQYDEIVAAWFGLRKFLSKDHLCFRCQEKLGRKYA